MSKRKPKRSTLPKYQLRNKIYLSILLLDFFVFSFSNTQKTLISASKHELSTAPIYKSIPTPYPYPLSLNIPTATPSPAPSPAPQKAVAQRPAFVPKQVSAPQDAHLLIEKYASKYNVDKELLKKIAACESGFRPEAVNGPYAGMYQFLASTWASNRKVMGENPDPSLRFNAEEAVKTASFKISRDGPGAWPVCSKQV